MLGKRVLVVAVLLPVGLFIIYLGEVYFAAFITLVMVLAAHEYNRLMHITGLKPASALVLVAVGLLCIARYWNGFDSAPPLLSLVILTAITIHLFAYERGNLYAATDFGVTLAGILYIGWIGAYLISLRNLANGVYWLLFPLLIVWTADSAAYFIGRKFGRTPLSPRLSPKKTWEGYIAGLLFGTAAGGLIGWGLEAYLGSRHGFSALNGVLLGVMISSLTTLGDLGESMIKRQAGEKDSGTILPGHGGVFDRIDSWLWAGVVAFYIITWFFIP
jgi:phosphatidate cytidylyltransferase